MLRTAVPALRAEGSTHRWSCVLGALRRIVLSALAGACSGVSAGALDGDLVPGACPVSDSSLLELQEIARYRRARVPLSVTAVRAESLLVLEPGASELQFVPAGGVVELPGPPFPRLILASHSRLFAAGDSVLWLLDSTNSRFSAAVTVPGGRIVSVAVGRPYVWIAVDRDAGAEIRSYAQGRDSLRLRQRIDVPTIVSLHQLGDGTVLASETRSPFSVLVFDQDLRTISRIESAAVAGFPQEFLGAGGRPSIYALGVFHLGCGRALQVLADLKSDRRWLVLHSLARARPIRSSLVEGAPFGITQALPAARQLVGFREAPGQREIVVYRWRWVEPRRES